MSHSDTLKAMWLAQAGLEVAAQKEGDHEAALSHGERCDALRTGITALPILEMFVGLSRYLATERNEHLQAARIACQQKQPEVFAEKTAAHDAILAVEQWIAIHFPAMIKTTEGA